MDATQNTPTKDQIRALQIEAGEHHDQELVKTCDRALRGDADAVETVRDVLADAAAQD